MVKALLRKFISTVSSKQSKLSWDYMVIVFIKVTDFYLNRSSSSSDMLQKTKKTLKDVRLIELAKSFVKKICN